MISCTITSLQVNYNLPYIVPFFELGADADIVAQSLYRGLSKHWITDLKDIRTRTGPTTADTFVALTIFSGNGSVEVSAKDFGVSLRNALPKDRDTIVQVLAEALNSLSMHVPVSNWGNEVVNVAAELTIDDNCLVNNFLTELMPANLRAGASVQDIKFSHGIKTAVEKDGEWNCDISLVGRIGNPKAFWLVASVQALPIERVFENFGERVQYFEKAVVAGVSEVFSRIELVVRETTATIT